MANKLKRRTLVLGGVVAAGAAALALRPGDRGAGHSPYFQRLSSALDDAPVSTPTLVIDRQRMLANVATLKRHIDQRFQYRIVAKSLPSVGLLQELMAAADTDRLMLFHQPFLSEVAVALPHSDVLMGKPMPVKAAAAFYREHDSAGGFDPARQLQWLLDSPERLAQYAALADELGVNMRINIELDVGLRRGGVGSDAEIEAMLRVIRDHPRLSFAGLMGYEAHIVKVPGDPADYQARAMAAYRARLAAARALLGDQFPDELTLNCGGSPTYQLYDRGDYPFNELATGSCLVKPTDFDLPTLADHQPASWIATPVLKASDSLEIPVAGVGPLMAAWDRNRARSFFTYGGYWKAIPESPPGLSTNPLMGRSTNQEMLNGSRSVKLQPDDWIFLRPTQSEFVFLQFGDIAIYDQGGIVGRWPVLSGKA